MAKAQGKKAVAARGKSAVKKVASRVKRATAASAKKVAPKKAATRPAPAAKKPRPKAAAKPVRKTAAKPAAAKRPAKGPARKVAAKAKTAARAVRTATKKAVAKVAKPVKAAAKQVKPAAASRKRPVRTPSPPAAVTPRAAPPTAPAPAAPAEKKRGRRARPRVQSDGAPAAAWLSTEKPRSASFIPAPPRAEAPSAIAAPPASSDRLIRPEDVTDATIRTVPVRIDVEQGAGRFYVIATPNEVTVRPGEGVEWDFRYIGGADVTVEEIVIEFDKPSPFSHSIFRTRKPGGARPHRQISGAASASAAGRRVEYVVRAMTGFKTEVANARIAVNVAS